MEASAVNNSYGQGFRKTRAHQAPDRRVPERCRSRVALPRADTLPLLLEARAEPTSSCKRFFGAILRANAKDRDFPCRSAAAVRCRFPPTGGLFFRSRPIGKSPTSALKRRRCGCEAFCRPTQLCPPQPNSPPDTVIRAARPDFLIGACFNPCTTTHVRRAASRAQITASGMTGPGGPHRRASVARGHDAVLLLCFAINRAPAARQGPTVPIQDNLG